MAESGVFVVIPWDGMCMEEKVTLREEDVMGISTLNDLIFAERNSQTPLELHDRSTTTKWPVGMWAEHDGESFDHWLSDAHFNLISSILYNSHYSKQEQQEEY